MDKIIYKNITIDDNMMLIVQALMDKQGEIIEHYNAIRDWMNATEKIIDNINEFNEILVKTLKLHQENSDEEIST